MHAFFRRIVRGSITFLWDSDHILVELAIPVFVVKHHDGIRSLRNLGKNSLSGQRLRVDLDLLGAKGLGCISGKAFGTLEQCDPDYSDRIAR